MSRIGEQPIKLSEGVTVKTTANNVVVKGPKGSLNLKLRGQIKVKQEDNQLIVKRKGNTKKARALHGLTRTLIANMIEGVTKGFSKTLEIVGVGYKASLEGQNLVLKVGFSHPVLITPCEGINFEVTKNKIKISGIDKQLVGDIAAKIRKVRPPDPYKGKGIRYLGEEVKTKPGKTAKAVGV